MTHSRIIVALDYPSSELALAFVDKIDASQCRLKVGFELFLAAGPKFLNELHQRGFEVFLDLKFYDIPNTVAAACRAAASLGVWMINVHASGGARMIEAAREALEPMNHPPKLVAVTILTSMNKEDLQAIGYTRNPQQQVVHLAELARSSGADGVVCSAREASELRRACGSDFLLVTPGIRPEGTDPQDQSRTMSPRDALHAGSDYLVVGRPITGAVSPKGALTEMQVSLDSSPDC
jgi:orotidine-5'-phosphate decarboxylase